MLPRYVPKFEANKGAADYQSTVRGLVTEMHDSHGNVQNANASAERLGAYLPPVVVRYVENQTVVTNVLDERLPVKAGDVVLTVDGEPVEKRVEFFSRYTAASTPQALMRVVRYNLLPGNLAVSFTGHNVRHADGRQLQRVGIQPHVQAAPTIAGVVAGRDEVLEAAVRHLRERSKK